MTGETLFVFGLLLVTIILFVSDRLRLDVVAMLVILVLMLSGLAIAWRSIGRLRRSSGVTHRRFVRGRGRRCCELASPMRLATG